MLLDKHAKKIFKENGNMLIPWYLMAAYAYYEEDDPIISDKLFDEMAKRMKENWNDLDHFHKHLIDVDSLDAGTYIGDYPERVKGALEDLRNNHK